MLLWIVQQIIIAVVLIVSTNTVVVKNSPKAAVEVNKDKFITSYTILINYSLY